jgi:hypothetical protein
LVDTGSETNHLRRHVIDEYGTIDARFIQILEERPRGPAEFGNLLEVRPLSFHELERVWLEHLERLNVDVAVGDQDRRWVLGVGS